MQSEIPKASEYVSVAEAARYLGVARKIIYQLVDFGELRAVRVKGNIMIDAESLEKCRREGRIA
ncbi:MAG TPA: helix-turn-helix domain-containing protein [Desulfopila sp.]|nr:helix-turn-helix domain-containing protein [Desulfopila sp.]